MKRAQPERTNLFGDQNPRSTSHDSNLTQNAIQALEDCEERYHPPAFIDEREKIILEVSDTGKRSKEERGKKSFIPSLLQEKGLRNRTCLSKRRSCSPQMQFIQVNRKQGRKLLLVDF